MRLLLGKMQLCATHYSINRTVLDIDFRLS
jgi:hypothetical protein